jgi:FkbM family methyltransferase
MRFYPKHYKWFPNKYEQDAFMFIKNYLIPGSVCIDIGAHFGLYSIVFAKYYNCNVYSFEPTDSSSEILAKNIKYNKIGDRVRVINKAVSSKNGKLFFNVQDTLGSVANSLVDYHHSDENKTKYEVDVVSIDSFFKDIPYGFIKIDAEGAEYDVLMGAKETIRKNKPKMMLGLHPKAITANGHSLKMIWELITKEDYLCYLGNKQLTESEFCFRNDLFDVFLLHKSLNTGTTI